MTQAVSYVSMAERSLTHVKAPPAWLVQLHWFSTTCTGPQLALTNSPPRMLQARITGALELAKTSANTQRKPSCSYTTYIYKLLDVTAAELTLQRDTALVAECLLSSEFS